MKKGIDVSKWQGKIDWQKVNVDFAILRAGAGKAADSEFRRNAELCRKPIGVYWFSYAASAAEARAEARKCLETIRDFSVVLPVFFDWEYDSFESAQKRGITVTKALYNAMCVAFCEEISDAGYRAGVYYNLDYFRRFVDPKLVGKYYQWYAHYGGSKGPVDCDIWQYSSSGQVDGIAGDVDLDYLYDESILEEADEMTKDEVRAIIEEFLSGGSKPASKSLAAEWEDAKKAGITDGTNPQGYAKREEAAAMVVRAMSKWEK